VSPDVKTTVSEDVHANPTTDWLIGGEMGAPLHSFNWFEIPIGAISTWFESWRIVFSICLASQFSTFVYWKLQQIQLYNNVRCPIIGAKHPKKLGQRFEDCYPEFAIALLQIVITTGQFYCS
jgi:hypothetical protein